MPFRRLFLVITLAAAASCTQITAVKPGKVSIKSFYTAVSAIGWTSFETTRSVVWTDDGTRLQSITFFDPIAKGASLLRQRGSKAAAEMPKFDPAMAPLEVKELVEASLAQAGLNKVKTFNLQPVKFGGIPGFKFDVGFTTKSGVDYLGFVTAAIKKKSLFIVAYRGTRLHYFAKRRANAERVIRSIELKSVPSTEANSTGLD